MSTKYKHKISLVCNLYADTLFNKDNYTTKIDAQAEVFNYKGKLNGHECSLTLEQKDYGLVINVKIENDPSLYTNILPNIPYNIESYLKYLKLSILYYFEFKQNYELNITPSENIRGLINDLNEQYFYTSKHSFNPRIPPTWINHERFSSNITGYSYNSAYRNLKVFLSLESSYNGTILATYRTNTFNQHFELPSELSTTDNFIFLLDSLNAHQVYSTTQ